MHSLGGRANVSLQDLKDALRKPQVLKGKQTRISSSTSPKTQPYRYHESVYDYETSVQRLRNMLKDQEVNYSEQDITRHPAITESQAAKTGSYSDSIRSIPQATELLPLLNKHVLCIHQLEGKNRFIEEELRITKAKMEEVVDENARLHEELKTKVVEITLNEGSKMDEKEMIQDEKSGVTSNKNFAETIGIIDSQNPENVQIELEKIATLHASRTRRLESQLAEARNELERAEHTIDKLKSNLRHLESQDLLSGNEKTHVAGLCLKCAQNEAVIASTHVDANVKLVQRITCERDELMSTVGRLKSVMEDMRKRETEGHEQITKSIELVEEAQLEKTKALVEKEQVKDEIQRQRENYKKMLSDNQLAFDEEKEIYSQQVAKQIVNLQQQLQGMIEKQTVTQCQVEKLCREKADLLSELEKANSLVNNYSSQITKKTTDIKLSNATAIAQRDEALRQLRNYQNKALWEAREREQDIIRLKAELKDMKRRLSVAEKQASRASDEHIRSIEDLSACEKTVYSLQVTLEKLHSSRNDKLRIISNKAQQREEELINVIEELETKHSFNENELETMVNSQKSLICKLKEECLKLTQELEKITEKYKSENMQLTDMNKILSEKLERLSEQHQEMESQCVQHAKVHQVMTSKLKDMDKHAQLTAQQILEVLSKVDNVTRERDVLKKEIGFLQDQLETKHKIVAEKE
ncbi:serologically defined colon cancer antigen 8 homolog isoform X2 [Ptychodera flava]|uniref:serologically defined colon cancer antigen 8 homolog isoform X2 n=1 Tax=Ptychodera flava TaxID=63121 RepID=UPI003969CEFB